jgi:hypothetical protein
MSDEQDPEFGVEPKSPSKVEELLNRIAHYNNLLSKTKSKSVNAKICDQLDKLNEELKEYNKIVNKWKEVTAEGESITNPMTHEEKVEYMTAAMQLVEFSVNRGAVDLIISLYELILEKKGDANLYDIAKLKAAVIEKHEKLAKSKTAKDESQTSEKG